MSLETLKQIEAKFVGTGYEHDVLRSIIQQYGRLEDMLHERYNEMVANKEAELFANQQLYDALHGMKIDAAVYEWMRNRRLSIHDKYDLHQVAHAMKGRGLACEDVEMIAEAMRDLSV